MRRFWPVLLLLVLAALPVYLASPRRPSVGLASDFPMRASNRRISLDGPRNVRGLGGIPVGRDGHVRQGLVFRSNQLVNLTESDVSLLAKLKLHTILDFRREHETQAGSWKGTDSLQIVRLPMIVLCNPEGYGRMVSENRQAVSQTFHLLAQPDTYPVLYHCVAGKDRTGIVTALLLEVLGASRDVIMEDYLESQNNGGEFRVDADWLRGLFASVEAAGGVDRYLQEAGVPASDLSSLRSLLIE